jgi:serine/threonine protein kinase
MANTSFQHTVSPDWSDFVESDYEVDVEGASARVERYPPGHYYPIQIGEVLDGRYRIEHKLGHGGFTTVWMSYDRQATQNVALKIIEPGDAGEHEYNIQNEIIRTVRDTSRLITYLGTFFLQSSLGNHRVLVFPLRGPQS